MKAEIREALGRAAYEATAARVETSTAPSWQELPEVVRELHCIEAEAVVRKLAEQLAIPVLHVLFTEEDIKRLLEQL